MARQHRVTHPTLGVVTWREIQTAVAQRVEAAGKRICSWCFGEVPAGRMTRCGKEAYTERIQEAISWNVCCRRTIKAALGRGCALCGYRYPQEVDHILPVSLGGTGDPDNRRALCHRCHKEETARLRKERDRFVARSSALCSSSSSTHEMRHSLSPAGG